MLICDKCGKTIANVQPVVHYSTCASCWLIKKENMKESKKNNDTRTRKSMEGRMY